MHIHERGVNYGVCWFIKLKFKIVFLAFGSRELTKNHTFYRSDERELTGSGQDSTGANKKTLVLFVGGCTFAEISALRFLCQQEESTTEYLIATTSVINGNNFIEGLANELNDALSPFWTANMHAWVRHKEPEKIKLWFVNWHFYPT